MQIYNMTMNVAVNMPAQILCLLNRINAFKIYANKNINKKSRVNHFLKIKLRDIAIFWKETFTNVGNYFLWKNNFIYQHPKEMSHGLSVLNMFAKFSIWLYFLFCIFIITSPFYIRVHVIYLFCYHNFRWFRCCTVPTWIPMTGSNRKCLDQNDSWTKRATSSDAKK